ncbi:ubiquitin-conjugating enzyme E2 T-like [Branchiostoma floridae]|uniref:Ubiquitin-conjugating enzyme E2 T n=1 Tax=Branchiostoma floridae TaxID=7739 RepID=A0A9J7L4W3_BRAFL|nr:ubiquitin-conjugating enzyme E2 T-like [Branchiostoma floridae]
MQRAARMKREVEMFARDPPPGVSCWSKGDKLDELEAQILGAEGTPYHGGVFKLEIQVTERYPFQPPKVRFVTPIYHPNIDDGGRICLDILKMPPKGGWKPSLNVSTVLTSIQLLMAEPNPDDPLMTDISNEFKFNRPLYLENAKRWTEKHAMDNTAGNSGPSTSSTSGKENNPQSSENTESSGEDSESEEVRRAPAPPGVNRLKKRPALSTKSAGKKQCT